MGLTVGTWKGMSLLVTLIFVGTGCVQKTANSEVLRDKLFCSEKGREFMDTRRREGPQLVFSNEMYAYDPGRMTCLVHYEVLSPTAFSHVIADVSTNRGLYSFVSWFDEGARKIAEENCKNSELKGGGCMSLNEFEAKRDSLFQK